MPVTYKPIHKPNQLSLGNYPHTAIVTGWLPKTKITKLISEQYYSVVGQLYSPVRGINFLIRNLLANPQICQLFIFGVTPEDQNAGASRCLDDFFLSGVDPVQQEGKWRIKSPITGWIDGEIPLEHLNQLRKNINWWYFSSPDKIPEALKTIEYMAQPRLISPLLKPRAYPYQEPETPVLPGQLIGNTIHAKSTPEAWVKILHQIRSTGLVRPTGYDGKIQELINLQVVIDGDFDNEETSFPDWFPVTPESLQNYLPQILADQPYQEGVKYTYGQRMRSWFGVDQVSQIIQKLAGEKDAASAVISLWDTIDHERGGSPCLNHLWFRILDDKLFLSCLFRSNDMFSAWPLNVLGLRALQLYVCNQLKQVYPSLQIGQIATISQSAHIYDDCWENADKLIKVQYPKTVRNQDYTDAVGNFLIEIEGESPRQYIAIIQTSPSGDTVKQYKGINPLKLIREICTVNPSISPAHAGYLGLELSKASNAIKDNTSYTQDR